MGRVLVWWGGNVTGRNCVNLPEAGVVVHGSFTFTTMGADISDQVSRKFHCFSRRSRFGSKFWFIPVSTFKFLPLLPKRFDRHCCFMCPPVSTWLRLHGYIDRFYVHGTYTYGTVSNISSLATSDHDATRTITRHDQPLACRTRPLFHTAQFFIDKAWNTVTWWEECSESALMATDRLIQSTLVTLD